MMWSVASTLIVLSGCAGREAGEGVGSRDATVVNVEAELVQLRRDEVLQRVQLYIVNNGRALVRIHGMKLEAPGFRTAGWTKKDSPIPPGRGFNLPVPYGMATCARASGAPVVTLRVQARDMMYTVRVRPSDRDGVLERVREKECVARRLRQSVQLRFTNPRVEQDRDKRPVVSAVLEVSLLEPRVPTTITQIAGSVIYELRPVGRSGSPLAELVEANPTARIPVAFSVGRCDGHARAEAKKPYQFLVWVKQRAISEQAMSVEAPAAVRSHLDGVCPL